jgi:type II secretory pathway pseudopilin PulG
VQLRAREEEGFGLIELVIAMVMLNVGILALVASFQSGAVALARSSSVSNGAAVADKTMEVYRGLKNCAIYLKAPSGGGGDTTVNGQVITNGIPATASTTWYTKYFQDANAYAPASPFTYLASGQAWATDNTSLSQAYTGITTCAPPAILPTGSPDPNKAVQYVTGPDGQSYPVFTYVVVVTPSGAGTIKQVTVEVLNPRKTTQILARETSYFDPNVTSG